MIVVKKKIKKPLVISILAGSLALLTLLAVLLHALVLSRIGNEQTPEVPIDIIESIGESTHNTMPVAYPHIESADIELIEISGEYKYSFTRVEELKGESSSSAPFVLSYTDSDGEEQVYIPEVFEKDPSFEYNDIYSTTTDTALGSVQIYKLNYLCTALGTTYFNGRIPLTPNDYDKNQEELATFGLAPEDNPIRIKFYYYATDDKGQHVTNDKGEKKLESITIKIGEKVITGGGYYFTVSTSDGNRPYVYSTSNPYFDYALLSYTDYIKPMLVSKGLAGDDAFEPYLTTDFSQWKNTMYDEEGDIILPNSTVICGGDVVGAGFSVDDEGNKTYYNRTDEDESFTFELLENSTDPVYRRFYRSLVGSPVGVLSAPRALTSYTFTIPVTENSKGESVEYRYRIKKIESIFTENGEVTDNSITVGDNELIKVTYELTLDGEKIALADFSGVLDLTSPLIGEAEREIIRNSTVDKIASSLGTVDIVLKYTDETVKKHNVAMVITEIIEIVDKDNKPIEAVCDGAKVMFRYYTVTNGVKSEKPESTFIVISDELSADDKKIADALMGKKVSADYDISIDVYGIDCEIMASYTTYLIDEISYFYTSERIVSFAFAQASERDVYYGESFYKNTMDGKYSMYALNASACQMVVEILGGLGESATASLGFAGTRTVDIGITPEKMKKYGLYANTVYFELPRGITDIDYGDVPSESFLADLDDYRYYSTLGFTLYISDERIDGTRYIASSAYDLISVIDADVLQFLDESFTDFYARRNIVVTNISAINNFTFEFFMDDIKGKYSNELIHNNVYAYNGKLYHESQLTKDELAMASPHDAIEILLTPSGECTETKFSEYLEKNGYTKGSLHDFYGKKTVELESLATQNFKELTEALFYTYYQGNLTEEEQAAGFERGALLMKMSVRLYEGYGAYMYSYEFYKISDTRIMVKLYRENIVDGSTKNAVSDFYVTNTAFEKLVGLYLQILNGENISNDTPFVDFSK